MSELVTGFIAARNYTKVDPGRGVLWVVLHAMQNQEKPGRAKAAARWAAGSSAPRASWHYGFDAEETWQSVKDKDVAWGASGANRHGLHFEHCGYSEQVADDWSDDFSARMLDRSARLCALKCREHGIPPRFVDAAALRRGEPGITTHAQVEKAWPSSGHWDPGLHFPLSHYVATVARLVQPATPQEAHMLFPGTQTVPVPGARARADGRWPLWGWKPDGSVFHWNFHGDMPRKGPSEEDKRKITAEGANVIGLHPRTDGVFGFYLVTDMADESGGLNTHTY
jgi:hypothetical protein